MDYYHYIFYLIGGVWEHFACTADPDVQECKICGKKIKTTKGSKTGMEAHLALYAKRGQRLDKENLKVWLIAGMVAILNMPFRTFGRLIIRVLFWLVRLGLVNEQIARRTTDCEAE